VRPLVKICGLTRPGDARLAVSLGATHIGVVRTESSPRSVSAELAREVFDVARGKAETVFVFKDVPLSQVIEDARVSGASGVQLYDASDDDVRAVASEGYRVYRVYRMDEASSSLPRFDPPPSESQPALLDVGGGGSGRSFDWSLFGMRAPEATFIAGGIRPDNVRSLLKYQPYGIDLASGVESRPGVKDEAKLRALFKEVC
jgi:indole-3-glycerol phosphate synthase/phosphoribosylanthranilate isomerase